MGERYDAASIAALGVRRSASGRARSCAWWADARARSSPSRKLWGICGFSRQCRLDPFLRLEKLRSSPCPDVRWPCISGSAARSTACTQPQTARGLHRRRPSPSAACRRAFRRLASAERPDPAPGPNRLIVQSWRFHRISRRTSIHAVLSLWPRRRRADRAHARQRGGQ